METVKRYSWALKYIKEQSNELCMEAVKRSGYAYKYVKNPTPELFWEAVKTYAEWLKLEKNPPYDKLLETIRINPYAIIYILPKDRTDELYIEACKNKKFYLEWLNEEEKTLERCKVAVKYNCNNVKHVPKEIKNKSTNRLDE